MNKVKSTIRITEVDGLSDSVIRIFGADSKAQEDAFLKSQIAELTVLSDAITEAILKDKAVSNLDEADSKRDEAVRNLGALLSGYAVFPLEEKKAAAISLKAIYDKYAKSGILSASYVSESSMIESLLKDLSSAEAAADIEKLDGVAEIIAAIRAAQDNFTAANDAFVKAEGSKGASASSYKKPILAVINDKIVPYLNTMAIVGNTAVADFAKGVETEISRVNESVAKRGK
ncbi:MULTISPECIES: DUF6261 family protein [unclassified Treponema]|uniref:DUF6261 family protein n=1 Tax=unclassified Treponema TaxID=2638727 RepID=UPI000E9C3823|nr:MULTISPECIES: DUF6261 family protein [unclassified Treponema]HBP09149.1 hypothetical protein [Treponema sp.]